MKNIFKLVLVFVALSFFQKLSAQSISIGSFEDRDLRSKQLNGQLPLATSLMVRPLAVKLLPTDSLQTPEDSISHKLMLLPISIFSKFNSGHPYGWNDQGFIPAKGFQIAATGGIYAKFGKVDMQLKPEIVFVQNPKYRTNTFYGPSIFGSFTKILPGQSFLRLNLRKISFGLSTENLWWGPGVYNSLLMSNNAPGFMHFTFNTREPVKTKIGSFEWQLVGGRITDADAEMPYENLYNQLQNVNTEWRYFNGITFTYSPKWTPGLFLGLSRSFQAYHSRLKIPPTNFLSSYLPVINTLFKTNTTNEDEKGRDQLLSIFARWLLVKEKAEVYFEYGFNDHAYNVRDITLSPTHSAAYIVGFQKMFRLKNQKELQFNIEATQLSQTPNHVVRSAGNWYLHTPITQGYTHQNQIMGAGIGSGNNVQTIELTRHDGTDRLGIMFERIEHDPVNFVAKWTDLSLGIMKQKKINSWVISSKFQLIRSFNYGWEKDVNRFNAYWSLNASCKL